MKVQRVSSLFDSEKLLRTHAPVYVEAFMRVEMAGQNWKVK